MVANGCLFPRKCGLWNIARALKQMPRLAKSLEDPPFFGYDGDSIKSGDIKQLFKYPDLAGCHQYT